MTGLSFYICMGKWARPRISFTRICLGYIAFGFIAHDFERAIHAAVILLKKYKELEKKLKDVSQPQM